MFCKKCSQEIDDDSTYCSFCRAEQSKKNRPDTKGISKPDETVSDFVIKPGSDLLEKKLKYDPTYKKEEDAHIVGIILLILNLFIFIYAKYAGFEDVDSYLQFRGILTILSLIEMIGVTSWVVNIAKRQNRETFGWGVLAFFFPPIALIIISNIKKLYAPLILIEGMNNKQNSVNFSVKAKELYQNEKYGDCIRFSKKAIELDSENKLAQEMLQKSEAALLNHLDSNKRVPETTFQTKFIETTKGDHLKIIISNDIKTPDEVFIDDIPAPDGIYESNAQDCRLVIQNGVIQQRYYIEKYKKFYVYKKYENTFSVGDSVVNLDGQPITDGKYSLGFALGKMLVEGGKIIKFI